MRQIESVGSPGELKGIHVLLIIVAFFGVIIGVNILLAVLANSTWSGFATPNSYVASQNFNREVAAAKAQGALGWSQAVLINDQQVSVKVTDAGGRGLSGLKVQVLLQRPTTDKQDHVLELGDLGGGQYSAALSVEPGVWIADVTAQSGDGRLLRRIHRLSIQRGS